MGFRKQLVIGLAASVLVTVLTATTAIVALRVAVTSADRVSRQFASDLALVQDLRAHAERLVSASRGFLLTGRPVQRTRFVDAEEAFLESLGTLSQRGVLNRTADEVAQLAEDAAEYVAAVRRAGYRRAGPGGDNDTDMAVYFDEELAPRREAFEASADAFVREAKDLLGDAIERFEARATTAESALLVTSLLGIAISMTLASLVMRRLSRLFRRAEAATQSARRAAEAREEILAIVSHDLRNPLNALVLSASVLGISALAPQERKLVDSMARAADRMQHLINDLVDNARVESGQFALHRESCSAASLIAEAAELFAEPARDKQVQVNVESEDFRIDVDRERVLQVLGNLIANALKFSPPGSEISVSARRGESSARFEVADEGPGIAPEQQPRLFDRYWQGSERSEAGSVGLGLFICKQIVDAHGGTIGVASSVGRGSTFWFEIPVPAAPSLTVG